jgi:hypothetical protein
MLAANSIALSLQNYTITQLHAIHLIKHVTQLQLRHPHITTHCFTHLVCILTNTHFSSSVNEAKIHGPEG